MKGTIAGAWIELQERLRPCRECGNKNLLDESAMPLFGKFNPRRSGVLFVFEAPNLSDTVRPGKQYITYDFIEDETGRFTSKLFKETLGIDHYDFQVTNAALCLPRLRDGKYPVTSLQAKNCSKHLRSQIELLQPAIVASVGRVALDALRRLETFGYQGLSEVIGKPREWFGRHIFPLAHTSRLGRVFRSEQDQLSDWRRLATFAAEQRISLQSAEPN
jgi:uracil-DNA glycosylase family 4